jgi:hypothetical protein
VRNDFELSLLAANLAAFFAARSELNLGGGGGVLARELLLDAKGEDEADLGPAMSGGGGGEVELVMVT